MKTLNEKAREYADAHTRSNMNEIDIEQSYLAGVTEATRWRYVNVELPSLDVKILIKAIDGEVRTGSMINQHQFSFDGDSNSPHYTVRTNVKYCGGKADIVSWRPIETI